MESVQLAVRLDGFPTLPHSKWVTLGRKFNLPEPWFPHPQNRDVDFDGRVHLAEILTAFSKVGCLASALYEFP